MDNFMTWETLLTYGGCLAGTVLVTEFVKKIWKNAPAQLVSFVISLAILTVGKLATNAFTVNELPLHIINAVAVSLASNGGFDFVKKLFGGDQSNGELIVDMSSEEEGEGVYLTAFQDPKEFNDGDRVYFTVKKTSQEKPVV